MNFWRRHRLLLLIIGDLLTLNAAFLIAYLIRFGLQIPPENFLPYLRYFALYSALYIGLVAVFGAYETEKGFNFFDHLLVLLPTVGLFIFLQLGLIFVLREFSFPRLVLIYSYVLLWILSAALHSLDSLILRRTATKPRALIMGRKREAEALLPQLRRSGELDVAGAMLFDGGELPGVRSHQPAPLERLMAETEADEILLISSPEFASRALQVLVEAKEKDLPVFLVPSLFEMLTSTPSFSRTGNVPVVEVWRSGGSSADRFLKRGLDVIASLGLLLVLSPVLLVAALGILLSSPGPVLLRQERVGKGGKAFSVVKFRTMKQDAERETGPVFARENDPRVTAFGRFLRLLRIDELPQMFNVLKGEMSLVGPRPERPVFVEEFSRKVPGYALRFLVKPGMTGMAQIYGTYETTPENKLRYDLAYIRNQSFLLDLRLLFLTFKLMLGRKGAR